MDIFITKDGSLTIFNEEYQEYYHSKSGAKEEAIEKYAKPCRIAQLSAAGKIRILDIGFGLGYNALASIDAAMEGSPNCEIEIISLEKDASVIEKAKGLEPAFRNSHILKSLEFDPKTKSFYFENKNIFLKIKIGDAVDTIKSLNGKFDAVFLDAFSPSKNKELWTAEFLSEIFRLMRPGAIMSTYSYARKVRESLSATGFIVKDGPVIGRRSPCTLAIKP